MSKKILAFFGLFVLAVVVSLVFLVKGKPSAGNKNPFKYKTIDQISKVVLFENETALGLEQVGSTWRITTPVNDSVDLYSTERLLETITELSIGSVVSENADKYSQFQLDQEQGKRIRVYLKGKDDPLLDGYFGKQAVGYGSLYFRFEGKAPVHLVHGFPSYMLNRTANDYRLKELMPVLLKELDSIQFEAGKFSLNLTRSSATWTNTKTGDTLPGSWVQELSSKIQALRAYEFLDEEKLAQKHGFETPLLIMTAMGVGGALNVVIGSLQSQGDGGTGSKRYAKVDGRATVLLISQTPPDDLIVHLVSKPKS